MKPQNPPQPFNSWNDFYDFIESRHQLDEQAFVWTETRYVDSDESSFQVFKVRYSVEEIRLRAFEELRQKDKTASFNEAELRYLLQAMNDAFKLLFNVQNSSYPQLSLRNKLDRMLYDTRENERKTYRNNPPTLRPDESSS